ncbi:winged helix-turn-helix domain-containing protein [Streptomyces sp. NPDC085927]|uniref:winged helix-turn-helix domain-containing protein n=1 Tax=Streptomyces sp. NPDC085927 TaxID=3365738 RepID=UPI0037D841EE
MATVLARRFHVSLSVAQTSRILHQMGWTVRVPVHRAAISWFGVSGWRVGGGFPWCCPDVLVSELGIGLAAGVATVVR